MPMSPQHPTPPPTPRRDILVAFFCGGLVAAMVGLSFAAVPFYSWFCRTTGYGGTTQVAKSAPTHISNRTITVRFDSNVAAGLPWRFEPERRTHRRQARRGGHRLLCGHQPLVSVRLRAGCWRRPRTSLRSPGAADHTIESGAAAFSTLAQAQVAGRAAFVA
jgi:hypothetical protein